MTKAQRVQEYNKLNKSYNITNIKKMTQDEIDSRKQYVAKSLDELYARPSHAKENSYDEILNTYKPQEILAVAGSSHAYSVLLVAETGDKLFITRSNNYLVEVA